jgi:tetratricopeptide (TPR) repeat protein
MGTVQTGVRVKRLLLALLLGAMLLFRQPLASRVLSNLGIIELSRVLVDSLESPRLQSLQRAESLLRQANTWDGGNASAHRGLAWVSMVLGEYAEAAVQWQAAGMTAQDMSRWADQARRAGRLGEALLWYEQMVLLEPARQDQALYDQYVLLAEMGEATKGLRPDSPAVWVELIRFWRRNGESERAESLCVQALSGPFAAQLGEACARP